MHSVAFNRALKRNMRNRNKKYDPVQKWKSMKSKIKTRAQKSRTQTGPVQPHGQKSLALPDHAQPHGQKSHGMKSSENCPERRNRAPAPALQQQMRELWPKRKKLLQNHAPTLGLK
jgi:hypothetical protein